VNFYCRFCLGFSKTVRPLNDLLRKDASRVWDERCTKAFKELKRLIGQGPVLVYFDLARETFVECDASDYTVGGVLS
jgi:RNase H-like domain found in reverse transcriptase